MENPDYRRIVRHAHRVSYKRICMAVFLLGEVVEKILTRLLYRKRVCCMHDGVTRESMHYICFYASWIHDEGTENERLQIALLGCSPIPAIELEEDAIEHDALMNVSTQLILILYPHTESLN